MFLPARTGNRLIMSNTWIHIPTPGDHYSAAYGSAIMTIIHEFARVYAQHGGRTEVIVALGTKRDRAQGESEGGAGQAIEVRFGDHPTRRQMMLDALLGRLGGNRLFVPRHWSAAVEAIARDFDGPIFLHNTPAPAPLIARARPRAQHCLWLNNEVWRSYGSGEVRRVVGEVDRVICASDFLAQGTLQRVGNAPQLRAKVRVARSGVNIEQFHPDATRAPNAVPVIAFIGRVVPEKGVHLLVQAAHELKERGHKFVIRIIGSRQFDAREALTAYESELREMAAPLGEMIEFVPAVDRIRVVKEFQGADVFCAPAIWNEPLGLTILEALACGVPTVTTRRGGIPEVGGDAALYFDPDKPGALAEVLEHLITDDKTRLEHALKARAHAESMSWEKQYDELVAALN